MEERFETSHPVGPDLQEDIVWTEEVAPRLAALPENVWAICHYGFTEMLNNVVDHSGSERVHIAVRRTSGQIVLEVADGGVGVFRKIREALGLENDHQAAIELTKGKLTTDRQRHSGEGIFFTARMFDRFLLHSGTVTLVCRPDRDFWFEEVGESRPPRGTLVTMVIDEGSKRTTREVFERFSQAGDSFDFDRTVLSLQLEAAGSGPLVSRSQAKRLVARLDLFKSVILDFTGVAEIGPAFADEVFRVFARAHPEVGLTTLNANEQVSRMIQRVEAGAETDR